jgi:hypothetical protein
MIRNLFPISFNIVQNDIKKSIPVYQTIYGANDDNITFL